MITLAVALNSHNNALMTILISNQFVELKVGKTTKAETKTNEKKKNKDPKECKSEEKKKAP